MGKMGTSVESMKVEGSMRNFSVRKSFFAGLAGVLLVVSSTHALSVSSYQKLTDGVLFTLNQGKLKIEVASNEIFRVVYSLDTIPSAAGRIVVQTTWGTPSFTVTEDASTVTIATSTIKAIITKSSAAVSYTDLSGTALLSETATGKSLVATSGHYQGNLAFGLTANEGIYGFGQPGKVAAVGTGDPSLLTNLNLRNESFTMYNCNRSLVIPFFVSTAGYGVLVNCYSMMNVTPGISIEQDWATNNAVDYYFMHGPSMDSVVSHYRWLTGPSPMLPKSAFGFISSFCQYNSQTDVENAATGYRNANIPVDYIVQDWSWWTADGSDVFNGNYANPTQMVSDLHAKNCSFMISVWPSFATGTANYTTMNNAGYLSTAKDYLGYLCDMSIPGAPQLYWSMIKTSPWNTGMDAWWFDATDPEVLNGVTWSQQYFNIYSLIHSGGVYTGQRATTSDKRVFILTRSCYAGQQRYGSTVWSGDIDPSLAELVKQVPGGLNVGAAGYPYWTTDIGGYQSGCPDDCYLRWFEYGCFCPMFRVHGVVHKEIYLQTGAKLAVGLTYDKLRYKLLPYIYSVAWMVTNNNYTMMRMLPFDYPSDAAVRNCTDEFMFGPAFLVCPVLQADVTSRSVYLPAGTWYDFWRGTSTAGAKTITASAPQDTIPVYVKAGSIVPIGPLVQYATQKQPDTVEVRVYPGADGSFTLYEDEGNNYNYEKGSYSTIPFTWNNASQTLTIGNRQGTFTGMLATRLFNVVIVSQNHGVDQTVTANPDAHVTYTGTAISVKNGQITGLKQSGLGVVSPPWNFSVSGARQSLVKVNFSVPLAAAGQPLSIRLYDMQGAAVRTLVTGAAGAGNHSVGLGGENGGVLRSGKYLCRMQCGEFDKTVNMIIVR